MDSKVRIIVDEALPRYISGQRITGSVEVTTNERIPNGELMLSLGWKGNGEGPRGPVSVTRDVETKTLAAGDWEAGRYVHPFELRIPLEGRSYRGQIMEVSWYLRAEARVEAKVTGLDEMPIDVESSPEGGAQPPGDNQGEVVSKDALQWTGGCLFVSLAALFGGVGIVWKYIDSDGALFGLMLAALGLVGTGIGVRGLLVKKKLTDVEVRLGSRTVRAGRELPLTVRFQARTPLEIQRISVVLKGWEQVGSARLDRTAVPLKKHVLCEQECVLPAVTGQVPAGFPVEVAGKIKIPANAPCSLSLDPLQIVWRLELRIAVARSPDWCDIQPITVLPAVLDSEHFSEGYDHA